jgi:trigger factor
MTNDDLQSSDTQEDVESDDSTLHLDVAIASPSACQRHITVTVAREDIDRYLNDAFSEMMSTANVPGFRIGRAPRKLVETRYRKEVADQIKGSLLIDSMAQVNEDHNLAAISEPDIDLGSVELPVEGPLTFEFDLEVRPEFDLPDWKGLKIERPTAEFSDADVDEQLERVLANYGKRVPSEDPIKEGDYITVQISASSDGSTLDSGVEKTICVRPNLSFSDGTVEGFAKLVAGSKCGDKITASVKLVDDAANAELAGKEIQVEFEILDIKKFELPELNSDFLTQIGNFDSEADLRDAIKDSLQRQLDYQQQQRARQQITQLLTAAADWELPPEMLKRQSGRELERKIMELRRSGFPEADIQAHANELRQNSQETTATALREHFILERIAEEEEIDAEEADYDKEVSLIAMQTGDSPRRVRAQIEKKGLMDSLRNQIVERRVIDLVLGEAKFKDIPFDAEGGNTEAVDLALGGGDQNEIPVAMHGQEEGLSEPKDHT